MARSSQTTRIKGARVVLRTSASGKVTIKPAPVEEWLLQAAAVRALRALPEYGIWFLLAGDFNAGRRSMQEQVKAKATGLTAGEHDVRIYIFGGKLGLIEMKAENGRLSKEQKQRHIDLAALGFDMQHVLWATSEEDAASQAIAVVHGWLAMAMAA